MPYTLAAEFEQSGVGLHSGAMTHVRVLPASTGEGRYFVRVDLPECPRVPARLEMVSQTLLSTQLGRDNNAVRTVEHLLAALAGMGVEDARIEIDGSEVPLLDGSAQVWVEAIAQVGLTAQPAPESDPSTDINSPLPLCKPPLSHQGRGVGGEGGLAPLPEPIWIYHGDAFACALPSPELRFTYGIDFNLPAIGNQWYSWSPSQEAFADAIAPARTFGLAHQIDELRAKGLIKGGSLDNALVCSAQGWLNPPLRFANEPVRHKILDLVGDLSLLGRFPLAHFFAYKASHNLHIQLAQRILDSEVVGNR